MGNSQNKEQEQMQGQQVPQQQQQSSFSTKKMNKKGNIQQQIGSNFMSTQLNNNEKFDDDEPIQIQEKQENQEEQKEEVKPKQNVFDLEKDLTFELKSMTKAIKLNSQEVQYIPAMISIETKQQKNQEIDLEKRPSIDLICVIDKSGSMSGEKMKQVRETLNYLLELLNENDRIMLVQFANSATRILPLTRSSKDNRGKIESAIESLKAGGGTNIKSGMMLALKGIKERKFQNPVTSVFLLSDGIDHSGAVDFLSTQGEVEGNPYTINSFGFGANHDPILMNNICKVKDGNFYYVEHIDTVDEMFIDALGGLFSVVAQNLEIKTKLDKTNKIFNDVMVSKTYGDMWKYDENSNEYNINLIQLISGVSKEFLIELQLPPIEHKLQDYERNTVLVSSELIVYSNEDKEKKNPIKKKAELELTFYNEDEEIPQEIGEINDNVQVNYLRVRGADMIQQCMQQAEQGNYDQGQKLVDNVQKEIEKARPENRKKLQMLVDDLEESKQTCTQNRYQTEGRFKMLSNNKAHMEKKSRNKKVMMFNKETNEMQLEQQQDMYQNCTQQLMVEKRQTMKSKW